MIDNFRALKIHNTTLVIPKEHFDKVFKAAKATYGVVEVEVTEELLRDAILLINR